jgi:hypothetical protein
MIRSNKPSPMLPTLLGIYQERDVLHCWDDIQPMLFRTQAHNNFVAEHLFRKLERIPLGCRWWIVRPLVQSRP